MLRLFALVTLVAVAGCGGKTEYRPTAAPTQIKNTQTVAMSKSTLWDRLIPALGKEFFVINNLDKDSGLINVSYSGDPEPYVDCGTITSHVSNLAGERNYVFPGARASQYYEILDPQYGLFAVQRTMSLEGRINIILEEVDKKTTAVTVNTRYVLTRMTNMQHVSGQTTSNTATGSFNTGQTGVVGNPPSEITCRATGKIEGSILALLPSN